MRRIRWPFSGVLGVTARAAVALAAVAFAAAGPVQAVSHSVRCDLNGDGFGDLVIGVPGEAVGAVADAGAIEVLYGSAGGLSPDGAQIFTQSTGSIHGVVERGDWFGVVTECGDVDGDGIADLVVGVPFEDLGSVVDAGSIHVLYGSPAGISDAGNNVWHQGTTDVRGVNEQGDLFGTALAIGDFNGDGHPDLAIGAAGEAIGATVKAGAVHVLYGTNSGLAAEGNVVLHQDASGVPGVAEAGDQFGSHLVAGDFNGDGLADLAVGISFEDIGVERDAGAIHVFYGSTSGLSGQLDQSINQNTPGVKGASEAGDLFGDALAVGNFDGDAFDDIAVGIPGEDVGSIVDAGAVAVLKGSAAGLTVTGDLIFDQDSTDVGGTAEQGDSFGLSLGAGNSNADGADDLAIGVPLEDLGGIVDAGTAHVLFGVQGAGLSAAGSRTIHQDTDGIAGSPEVDDRFAWAVSFGSFGGDLNADLAIGVPREGRGAQPHSGTVLEVPGSVDGPDTEASSTWHQDSADVPGVAEMLDRFGWLGGVSLSAAPSPETSDQTIRAMRCQVRVNAHASRSHPGLTIAETNARTAWLQSQCDQNVATERVAEPHGSTAPELFPPGELDRNNSPLQCMVLNDDRFGLTPNVGDPGVDPAAAGGSPATNVPGDFMLAVIEGEPHLMVRTLTWAHDDMDGTVVEPVSISVEVWYQEQGASTVAIVPFAQAFRPRSVWVELLDDLANAFGYEPAVLQGRVAVLRSNIAVSGCHDKRAPVVVPGILLARAEFLGWLSDDAPAYAQSERFRFTAIGDPNAAASWWIETTQVTLPSTINFFNGHPWFYDDEVGYASTPDPIDFLPPSVDASHAPFSVFPGPVVMLNGDASDDTAVAQVQVAIRDRNTGLWLQNDGSFGAKRWMEAALDDIRAATTDWTWSRGLPPGSYNVEVRTYDVAGRLGAMTVWRPFEVG